MSVVARLDVLIGANLDAFDKAMQGVAPKLSRVGESMQRIGGSMTRHITLPMMAAGAAAIKLAADAQEMQAKFDVVFKNVGGQVTKELDTFASAVGRSKYELRGMASQFGDLLKPMGFAEKDAGKLSVQMTKLATDLSSFNNMDPDEALRRLQGTLVGSHENALAFGVVINENTLKAEMAANGWDKLTGAAREQAKVQARMNLLMKGTTDAQGDALRTSGSFANQVRALGSQVRDLAIDIGMKLLPVATKLVGWASDAITWFRGLDQRTHGLVAAFAGAVGAIGPLIYAKGKLIALLPKLSLGLKMVWAATGPVGIALMGLTTAGLLLWRNWDSVTGWLAEAWLEFKFRFLQTALSITEGLESFINSSMGVIRPLAKTLGIELPEQVTIGSNSIRDALAKAGTELGTFRRDKLAATTEAAQELAEAAGDDGAAGALDGLGDDADATGLTLAGGPESLESRLRKAAEAMDDVGLAGAGTAQMLETATTTVGATYNKVTKTFEGVSDSIVVTSGIAIDRIRELPEEVRKAGNKSLAHVTAGPWTEFKNKLGETFSGLGGKIRKVFSDPGALFDKLKGGLAGVIAGVNPMTLAAQGGLALLKTMGLDLNNVLNEAGRIAGQVAGKIGKVFGKLASGIKNALGIGRSEREKEGVLQRFVDLFTSLKVDAPADQAALQAFGAVQAQASKAGLSLTDLLSSVGMTKEDLIGERIGRIRDYFESTGQSPLNALASFLHSGGNFDGLASQLGVTSDSILALVADALGVSVSDARALAATLGQGGGTGTGGGSDDVLGGKEPIGPAIQELIEMLDPSRSRPALIDAAIMGGGAFGNPLGVARDIATVLANFNDQFVQSTTASLDRLLKTDTLGEAANREFAELVRTEFVSLTEGLNALTGSLSDDNITRGLQDAVTLLNFVAEDFESLNDPAFLASVVREARSLVEGDTRQQITISLDGRTIAEQLIERFPGLIEINGG